jgi:hypothetical protein
MNRKAWMSIAAGVLCALAAAAPAAPDRTVPLGPGAQTFAWTGGEDVVSVSNQFPFGAFDPADPAGTCGSAGLPVPLVDYCDQTLVKLAAPGSVEFTLPEAGDGLVDDWDMYVYSADADGNAGDLLHSGEEIGGAESFVLDGAEGNYLVVAVPYQSVTSGFAGSVAFSIPEPVEE